jgi:hypothetical protein
MSKKENLKKKRSTSQNPTVGNSDVTNTGTAQAITLPPEETASSETAEQWNGGRAPTERGTGTDRSLDNLAESQLLTVQDSLEDNHYPCPTVSYGNYRYTADLKSNAIEAMDNNNALVKFNGNSAYTFVNEKYKINRCVGLELIEEPDSLGVTAPFLYALFSSGDSFAGTWADSTVTRLAFGADGQLIEQS